MRYWEYSVYDIQINNCECITDYIVFIRACQMSQLNNSSKLQRILCIEWKWEGTRPSNKIYSLFWNFSRSIFLAKWPKQCNCIYKRIAWKPGVQSAILSTSNYLPTLTLGNEIHDVQNMTKDKSSLILRYLSCNVILYNEFVTYHYL